MHDFTICFVSSAHPPLDVRIFHKEAKSLAKAGFRVLHLAPGSGDRWHHDGVAIQTYRARKGLLHRAFGLFALVRRVNSVRANCYHCNEVDSWLAAIIVSWVTGRKVVFDVHEDYPGMISDRFKNCAVRWLSFSAIRLCLRVLTRASHCVVLAKSSIAGDFSGLESKVVLVRNFSPLVMIQDRPSRADAGALAHPITAVHAGSLTLKRGWKQLLVALTLTKRTNLRIEFLGWDDDHSQADFLELATRLKLQDRVAIVPAVDFTELPERLETYDIGLILFQPGYRNHLHALPHKLTDYMAAGLPVVAPEFAVEVAAIVRDSRCGLLIDSSDPRAIAAALDRLMDDVALRNEMGENGRRAVAEHYNWECEVARLIEVYRRLAVNATS